MDDVAASGLYDTLDVNSLAQVDTILDRWHLILHTLFLKNIAFIKDQGMSGHNLI